MRSRTCYLYVLPLAYENILKLGISHDPLARAQAFSRRYYEFFDLSRSLLVEFDSRREAQARETALHRRLRDWNAVQPITVPGAAAGKTEWYRGAYATICDELESDVASGRIVHQPALAWWHTRVGAERERLYEWGSQLLRDCEGSPLPDGLHALVVDTLNTYHALGVPLDGVLPVELAHFLSGLGGPAVRAGAWSPDDVPGWGGPGSASPLA